MANIFWTTRWREASTFWMYSGVEESTKSSGNGDEDMNVWDMGSRFFS